MGCLMVQWNCRSLRANGHWLRSSVFNSASIICLQETFLSPSDVTSLSGKHIYRADRTLARGGGLLTAVCTSIPSCLVPLPPCPQPDLETLGVKIFLNNSWILILNIYSPSGCFPEDWFTDVLNTFDPPVILLGDFNINILGRCPPILPKVRKFLEWVNAHDVCLLNTDNPTRSAPNNPPSLLDLELISPSLHDVIKYYVHPDTFDSDHHPICIFLSRSVAGFTSPHSSVNWAKAGSLLNSILPSPCPSYDVFEHACHQAISTFRYLRRRSSNSVPPWWDGTCSSLLREKRKHLKLARSLCSSEEWRKYKQCAARLRRHIKSISRNYWDSMCRNSCSSGRIFKILKRLANRENAQGGNILLNPNPIASVQAQAQVFLEHFEQEETFEPLPYDLSGEDRSLDDPFTYEELSHALNHTRPTSPGTDGISIKLLKQLTSDNLLSLLAIYNSSFESATIPSSWKLATIVPIRKPGKLPHLLSSYRPIALTSVCAKVFERMILRRLLIWTGTRNIFHQCHFGFIPFRDCTTALCTLLDDLLKARLMNHFVALVCLDIKAAYDSVWIDNLIYKLATIGIRGKLGRWVAAFLTNRDIRIRWKDFLSQTGPCRRGVPQGSVLSPLLFLIYMFDLFDILEDGVYMIVYADDIFVYAIGPDEAKARGKLNNALSNINKWCSANKLKISPDKCISINFSRRRDPGNPPKLLGHDLPWSPMAKILGIWFTRNLNFNHHFSVIRTKVLRRLNYMKAIASRTRGVNSSHMLRIINALVRSLIEYGNALFFDVNPTALNSLEVLYNAALRVATGLPMWTPLPVLRREAGACTITSRLAYLTKVFLVKQLALPPGPSFRESLRRPLPTDHFQSKWMRLLRDLTDFYQFNPDNILRFTWPPPPHSPSPVIITEGLPFQDLSLPNRTLAAAWTHWRASLSCHTIFSTDASKDGLKTAVAALDADTGYSLAALTSQLNSIFTAEALALCLAVSHLPSAFNDIIILSDSLSVLNALRSYSHRSPKVILFLLSCISRRINTGNCITLVWCPAHKGIVPNEQADALAKDGPYMCQTIPWISPEDLCSRIKKNWFVENDSIWINSDYAPSFSHLSTDRDFPKWTQSREMDVLIARWRSRTILTYHRLYRMNQVFSPLCRFCFDLDTPDHILLTCPFLRGPRQLLFSTLNLHPPFDYHTVMDAAVSHRLGVNALMNFSTKTWLC